MSDVADTVPTPPTPPAASAEALVDRHPLPYDHWRRRLARARLDPWGTLMHLIGDHTVGGSSVPLSWRTRKLLGSGRERELWVSTEDDGPSVWLTAIYREMGMKDGRPHEYVDETAARDLTLREQRFLLRELVTRELLGWFGLRRRLYFWALTRHLDRSMSRCPRCHRSIHDVNTAMVLGRYRPCDHRWHAGKDDVLVRLHGRPT